MKRIASCINLPDTPGYTLIHKGYGIGLLYVYSSLIGKIHHTQARYPRPCIEAEGT